jgi:cytochrome c oxidase cbb3-type subunit 1
MYYVMPRVMQREWPYPKLILLHFWLVILGFGIYFVSLTFGGWFQGLAMLDATRPFMESVTLTLPYLKARSIGGGLMTLAHVVFAVHFLALVLKLGPTRDAPALFYMPKGERA